MAGAQQGWRNSGGMASIIGGLNFLGSWNANTNIPVITSGVGSTGDYYVVSVAGATNIDGISDWEIGDWIIFNGTIWQKIDNTDQVVSVNALQGVVTIDLESVLAQGTSTGAFDISIDAGQGIIYNNGAFTNTLGVSALTANHTVDLPNKSGVVALTSDIPSTAITLNVIPAGTGTGIVDGTWEFSGDDIRPITTGSNIGDATHRVATIFMSSVIDYSTDLLFSSGGTKMTLSTSGNLGVGLTPSARIHVQGVGADATTWSFIAQKSDTSPLLSLRNDGLSQFNTTASQLTGSSGAYQVRNIISDWNSVSSAAEVESAFAQRLTQNPTGVGAASGSAGRFTVTKEGANRVYLSIGSVHEALNTGSGNFITNDESGIYGAQFITSNTYANDITINSSWGVETDTRNITSTGGQAATYTSFGGLNIRFTNITRAAITNMYGIKVTNPVTTTGTTVTNTYGVFLNTNTLGTNNYGFYQEGTTINNILEGNLVIGTNIGVASTALTVRGTGNTSATNLSVFEDSAGTDRLIIRDDGQSSWGIGTGAIISAGFGQVNRTSGYANAYAFYGTNATTTSFLIGQLGDSPTGLFVQTQSSSTGVVRSGLFDNKATAGTEHAGVYGFARNGSQRSIGLDGKAGGGSGVLASDYVAGVRGATAENLDALSYGGRFTAQYSSVTTTYTKNMVGVYGEAITTTANVASTSTGIGGMFLTSGVVGSGLNMAINVPATGNNGNVVIGADASSANKTKVEVTGDMELIAIGDGFIVKSPDGTRWKFTPNNAGAWTSVSV